MNRIKSYFHYGGACELPPLTERAALKVDNLTYKYSGGSFNVLQNVSFRVEPGERVALVGPNGAGKSTLLKLILGMENMQQGSINVFGHGAAECLHRVSIVPQRSSVDWNFPVSVKEVVLMGRYVHLGWFRKPGPDDHRAVEESLSAMEIEDLADRQVGELSGGQQQRVMIARMLAHDADLMLLDEPLNHVDISTQELIFHTLERLTVKKRKAVIVSTHDLGVLKVHFTRALFLDHQIIADGKPEDVLTPEIIAKAYGFEFHKDYKPWIS